MQERMLSLYSVRVVAQAWDPTIVKTASILELGRGTVSFADVWNPILG